jgi:heme-degrading monooxygenase HmoA
VQWDSLDQLQAWRNSTQYKQDRQIGDKYATFRTFAVEGLTQ